MSADPTPRPISLPMSIGSKKQSKSIGEPPLSAHAAVHGLRLMRHESTRFAA